MPTSYTEATAPPLTAAGLRGAGLGAVFRPNQLEALGFGYSDLRRLLATGAVERIGRGLYRFVAAEPTEHHTLATVCAQVPDSIVCLLSALQVHDIGTQLPPEVWLAIPHKARPPRVSTRLRLIRFSGAAWTYGVVPTEFEGVSARITNLARTVVDCFRFERLVGREAAMEALREALQRKRVTTDALFRTLEVLPSRRLRAVLDALS